MHSEVWPITKEFQALVMYPNTKVAIFMRFSVAHEQFCFNFIKITMKDHTEITFIS